MVTALPEREREREVTTGLIGLLLKTPRDGLSLLSSFFLFLQTDGDSLARERERWQLDWLDHRRKHQGMGTVYRHLFSHSCRKMVTTLPERERGDNWSDWIIVNTRGWALFIVIFFSIFAGRWWQPCQRERERWQLNWLDHCCKHQGMGTSCLSSSFSHFCRKMVIALPEREREREVTTGLIGPLL